MAGDYSATEVKNITVQNLSSDDLAKVNYIPLVIIVIYILGSAIFRELYREDFQISSFMNNFMGAFFVFFSLFKILNLKGFADSFRMYDVVAKKIPFWGFLYPFIELLLGVSYLMEWFPVIVNATTFLLMIVGLIGVIKSILSKNQIKCACLGAFINIPLSSITIIENSLMAIMALVMLII